MIASRRSYNGALQDQIVRCLFPLRLVYKDTDGTNLRCVEVKLGWIRGGSTLRTRINAKACRRLLVQYYFPKGYNYSVHTLKDYQLRLSRI